jgi:tripeptide aminopeptidase
MLNQPAVANASIDREAAITRLMRFLAVTGVTGREARIAKELVAALREAGVAARSMRFDDAHTRIPLPTETGNLIVALPGRGSLKDAQPLLFMTHMDTVPLCAGAAPKRQARKIVNAAKTALGGDNRTGCAVLVTLAAELARQKAGHPPLTLLFTVREESGLWGARHVRREDLGAVVMGFNYDGRRANEVTIGAVGADSWEVEIFGRASHAGAAPERGISATLILAEALVAVRNGGWFGKIEKDGRSGTSNVGPIRGAGEAPPGDATNVVTDYLKICGESRSHDPGFCKEITAAYRVAFVNSAAAVANSEGKSGRARFSARTAYQPFRIRENAGVVRRAMAAVAAQGLSPQARIANGGLDANYMVRHGIPTVTFGAGQNGAHTIDEWVDLGEFEAACRVAFELATMH